MVRRVTFDDTGRDVGPAVYVLGANAPEILQT